MSAGIEGYVMAFDFGLRHIGVALGQALTSSGRGVATLTARQGKPNWPTVSQLLEDYAPGHLVVGLPLNMDGTPSDMALQAQRFAEQLARRSGLQVDLHDERLSTRAARSSFAEAQALGLARTEHELAACLILEGWLAAQ